MALQNSSFVEGIPGFKPDYLTAISYVVIQIRKAWTLTVNPRFPLDKSESILIAEVITNFRVLLLRCRNVDLIHLVDFWVDFVHHFFVIHTTVRNELGEPNPLSCVWWKFLSYCWLRPDVLSMTAKPRPVSPLHLLEKIF